MRRRRIGKRSPHAAYAHSPTRQEHQATGATVDVIPGSTVGELQRRRLQADMDSSQDGDGADFSRQTLAVQEDAFAGVTLDRLVQLCDRIVAAAVGRHRHDVRFLQPLLDWRAIVYAQRHVEVIACTPQVRRGSEGTRAVLVPLVPPKGLIRA